MSQMEQMLAKVGLFKHLSNNDLDRIATKHGLEKEDVKTRYNYFYSQVGTWSEQLDTRETFLSNFERYLEGKYDHIVKNW